MYFCSGEKSSASLLMQDGVLFDFGAATNLNLENEGVFLRLAILPIKCFFSLKHAVALQSCSGQANGVPVLELKRQWFPPRDRS